MDSHFAAKYQLKQRQVTSLSTPKPPPRVTLRVQDVATASGVGPRTTSTALETIIATLGRALQAHAVCDIDFGFGRLVCENRHVKFAVAQQADEAMGPSPLSPARRPAPPTKARPHRRTPRAASKSSHGRPTAKGNRLRSPASTSLAPFPSRGDDSDGGGNSRRAAGPGMTASAGAVPASTRPVGLRDGNIRLADARASEAVEAHRPAAASLAGLPFGTGRFTPVHRPSARVAASIAEYAALADAVLSPSAGEEGRGEDDATGTRSRPRFVDAADAASVASASSSSAASSASSAAPYVAVHHTPGLAAAAAAGVRAAEDSDADRARTGSRTTGARTDLVRLAASARGEHFAPVLSAFARTRLAPHRASGAAVPVPDVVGAHYAPRVAALSLRRDRAGVVVRRRRAPATARVRTLAPSGAGAGSRGSPLLDASAAMSSGVSDSEAEEEMAAGAAVSPDRELQRSGGSAFAATSPRTPGAVSVVIDGDGAFGTQRLRGDANGGGDGNGALLGSPRPPAASPLAPRPHKSPWRRRYDPASVEARAAAGLAQSTDVSGPAVSIPVGAGRRGGGGAGSPRGRVSGPASESPRTAVFARPVPLPSFREQSESPRSHTGSPRFTRRRHRFATAPPAEPTTLAMTSISAATAHASASSSSSSDGGAGHSAPLAAGFGAGISTARARGTVPHGGSAVADALVRDGTLVLASDGGTGSTHAAAAAAAARRRHLARFVRYVLSVPESGLAPLKREWVAGVLDRLPPPPAALAPAEVDAVVSGVVTDARDAYLFSLRRAVLNYLLRNPDERRRLQLRPLPEPFSLLDWGWGAGRRLAAVPDAWHESVAAGRTRLLRSLFAVHPCLVRLLDLWQRFSAHASLLPLPHTDAEALRGGWRPLAPAQFESVMLAHTATAVHALTSKWHPLATGIFVDAAKAGLLPDDRHALRALFDTAATLMALQLRSAVEAGLHAAVAFFDRFAGDHDPEEARLRRWALHRRHGSPAAARAHAVALRTVEEDAEERAFSAEAAEAAVSEAARREAMTDSDGSGPESGSEATETEVSVGGQADSESSGSRRRRHRRRRRGQAPRREPRYAAPHMAEARYAFEMSEDAAWDPAASWSSHDPSAGRGGVAAATADGTAADAGATGDVVPAFDAAADAGLTPGDGTAYSCRETALHRPAIRVRLVLHGSEIAMQVPAPEVERRVLRPFDNAVSCLSEVARVEHKGVGFDVSSPRLLQVLSPADAVVSRLRARCVERVREALRAVGRVAGLFRPFRFLLDEDVRVGPWLSSRPSLAALEARVETYRAAAARARTFAEEEVPLGAVLVECGPLNRALAARAEELATLVLAHVADGLVSRNQALCREFKDFSDRATRKPATSEDLVEAERFVEVERGPALEVLLEGARAVRDRVRFLFRHRFAVRQAVLQPLDATFGWARRIHSVLAAGEEAVAEERHRLEARARRSQEAFEAELGEWEAQVDALRDRGEMRLLRDTVDTVERLKEAVGTGLATAREINEEERRLGWDPTDYDRLRTVQASLRPFDELWSLALSFSRANAAWTRGPVFQLDADAVEREAEAMLRSAGSLSRALAEDAPAAAGLAGSIVAQLEAFRPSIPLIAAVCTRGVRDRHWRRMAAVVGFPIKPDDATSLQRLLEMGVLDHVDALQAVAETAAKEFAIEGGLDGMLAEWTPLELAVLPHRESGTHILQGGPVEEVQQLLDDHLVKTQTMRASSFAKAFSLRIQQWEKFLLHTQETLDVWTRVQATWLYLEPVFGSDDIMQQIPDAGERFKRVDAWWRQSMSRVAATPSVISVMKIPGLLQGLEEARASLDVIQKQLNAYLETKRLAFPRFFFLSNDELLEILAETKDPTRVQPHLKKCFEGIRSLDFQSNMDITSMVSSEGEIVELTRPLNPKSAKGAVEVWLGTLEARMRETVQETCVRAVADYAAQERVRWVVSWPGQLVLAVAQLMWTQDVERALRETGTVGLRTYLVDLDRQLEDIVRLVRGKLDKLARQTLSSLTVVEVHSRDVVKAMAAEGVSTVDEFDWVAQLRYYWESERLETKMINSHLEYGYEYIGNSGRLVITPLTDRCYRTLMGALHLQYGGAPEGPAGTGKTETVKDLSKNLARQCVVFNCSDGMDYLAMAKFFKGLASSGAWACFDEFNRIELEVLSVVAQQITVIQRSIAQRLTEFTFEGTHLQLKWTCNVFITMNPGYAGRAELPDNLKALFRTVAMMVPDYALIAEIILYSFGFMKSRALAVKIVATYKLCSEQLSSQDHYDYGMRAVKSVLVAAGSLKRSFPDENEDVLMLRAINDVNLAKFLSHDLPLFEGITSDLFPGITVPPPDYDDLMRNAIAVCKERNLQPTLPFLEKVVQLYEMVLVRHGLMVVGLPHAGKTECWRVLQQTLTALSHERKMPCKLHPQHELPTESFLINPKAVTMGELYGAFDPVSHEWTDGILATTFRKCASDTRLTRKWIVFDGPVDAIWIENMNTVLDDNKKLCLMSGEIIAMSDPMTMMFEPMDLAVASPATVSRCGMVYMEPHRLGWHPILASWLASLPDDVSRFRGLLEAFLQWLLPPALASVRESVSSAALRAASADDLGEAENGGGNDVGDGQLVPVSDAGMVTSTLRLLTTMLQHGLGASHCKAAGGEADFGGIQAASPREGRALVGGLVLASITWGVGGTLDDPGRRRFDASLRDAVRNAPSTPVGTENSEAEEVEEGYEAKAASDESEVRVRGTDPRALYGSPDAWGRELVGLVGPKGAVHLPGGSDTLFDVAFVCEGLGRWEPWAARLPAFTVDDTAAFEDLIVPTADTARYGFLVQCALAGRYPLLFTGPTGTGKTTILAAELQRAAKHVPTKVVNLLFSARTTAGSTQDQVDACTDRRRKGVYGPRPGSRLALFVDDLNMPAVEEYGAQPPLELLRHLLDHGGWYDRTERTFRTIVDTVLVAAMGPPGGGRSMPTPRLLRHCFVTGLPDLSSDALKAVFSSIVSWHFGKKGMPANAVSTVGSRLVAGTLRLYTWAKLSLRPTPSRSHYLFNPRDVARVVQGVCSLTPREVRTAVAQEEADGETRGLLSAVTRLWAHEALRVFSDRLVDVNDRGALFTELGASTAAVIGLDLDSLLEKVTPSTATTDVTKSGTTPGNAPVRRSGDGLLFGDFDGEGSRGRGAYICSSIGAAATVMETALEEANALSARKVDLVLFGYAVQHVSRVCRVLRLPGGHALLVGVGGSGRQSVTRLAAHMADCRVFQIEVGRGYGVSEWREDLRRVISQTGGDGTPTVFLLSDTQIKSEAFVEDVNTLLNGGEVPGLLSADDRAPLVEKAQAAARADGRRVEDPAELWHEVLRRVRRNLHIVLCFSPVGPAFRARLRRFPALVNCCTIDWFEPWPQEALEAVAAKSVASLPLGDAEREACASLFVHMHADTTDRALQFEKTTGRKVYVTPTSFLELLSAFHTLLEEQRSSVEQARFRYAEGLQRLSRTGESVADMQKELAGLKPVLLRSTEEIGVMMGVVDREQAEAEKIRKVVAAEEAVANEKAAIAKAIKDECEADLAEALPVLEAALEALKTLNKNDITEVRSMKTPPDGVKLVLKAVCVLVGVPPVKQRDPANPAVTVWDYWEPAKRVLLGDPKLLQNLQAFDKDSLNGAIVAKIRPLLGDPNFEPATVKRISKAAYGLCCWVRAMVEYHGVSLVVEPKREKLRSAEAELGVLMKSLKVKQGELRGVEKKVAELGEKLDEMVKRKEDLGRQVDECEAKLIRAEKLIQGLGGERTRWSEEEAKLRVRLAHTVGDVVLASGSVAYLGPFDAHHRRLASDSWSSAIRAAELPSSSAATLESVLGEPVRVREWQLAGLPRDSFSTENALIVTNARRWPLMIDPQGQANKWVRAMEKDNNLKVIKPTTTNMLRMVETCVQLGTPLLLEDVGEELEPALEPLLLRDTFKKGGILSIRLGDAVVEYSESFKFYMTTKLRNPHYLPEVAVKVSLLNFMITPLGLEDQLLAVTVAEERPDLEEERNALIVQSAANRRRLKDIEDEILRLLTSSEGNILDDESAVDALTSSKRVSDEIEEKQRVADITERKIDEARKAYVPVARRATVLFFATSDLAPIDPMYLYSLSWFVSIFLNAMERADKSPDVSTRVRLLNEYFTLALYRNVCRSLFEKDKLLFAFLLAVSICIDETKQDAARPADEDAGEQLVPTHRATASELRFLLTGGTVVGEPPKNPCAPWLPDRAWEEVQRLSSAHPAPFGELPASLRGERAQWKLYTESSQPEVAGELPGAWESKVTALQRLCLLRCLRPDRTIPGMEAFVSETLGDAFTDPPAFDLAGSFAESSHKAPLVFVLSPGSDPTATVQRFAALHKKQLASYSLGQGQGPLAEAAITAAAASGSWVMLQNCHLYPSWMPQLARICENLSDEGVNEGFRLWLTSYPSRHFPTSVLQNGVKMTNEPPSGLRANLQACLASDPLSDPGFYESCPRDSDFKRLAYGLCFFHAVVQQRRSFGPLGWNIPYEFNESDLRISVRQLHLFLSEHPTRPAPFKALQYLIGECNYGGRVTDDRDRRCLRALLDGFVAPPVLEDGYEFADGPAFAVPYAGPHAMAMEAARGLPHTVGPGVCGLHSNADIARARADGYAVLASLLLACGAETAEEAGEAEQDVADDAGAAQSATSVEATADTVAAEILTRLPEDLDEAAIARRFPLSYAESMNTVLAQEARRYNALLREVRESLRAVRRATAGLVVMSETLETVAATLLNGQVPSVWMAKSFPSRKPLAGYARDLGARVAFLRKWAETRAPESFWLSGFFFTQSFLTGVLQNHARKHKVSIDLIEFSFQCLARDDPRIGTAAPDGAIVHGLFLEGARWNERRGCLAECRPRVLYEQAPHIWLLPRTRADEKDTSATASTFACPVYKTSERRGTLSTTGHSTNFVMLLDLPAGDATPAHWVRRGVALLTQLDE